MDAKTRHELGSQIQGYIRSRRTQSSDDTPAREFPLSDRALRLRIDVLGIDSERLLTVSPDEVLSQLQILEHEAALEDSDADYKIANAENSSERRLNAPPNPKRPPHRMRARRYR